MQLRLVARLVRVRLVSRDLGLHVFDRFQTSSFLPVCGKLIAVAPPGTRELGRLQKDARERR
jgi:hypothetical protein